MSSPPPPDSTPLSTASTLTTCTTTMSTTPESSRSLSGSDVDVVDLSREEEADQAVQDEQGAGEMRSRGEEMPTTELLGRLKVQVVEAKGLAVEEGKLAKPYVLLQYDGTDSVSREYGAPPSAERPPPETKKGGIRRPRRSPRPPSADRSTVPRGETVRRVVGPSSSSYSSSAASSSLASSTSDYSTPASSPPSSGPASDTSLSHLTLRPVSPSPPTLPVSQIGLPSAPIWNHTATFDVVSPGRTVLVCVYDKLAPQGGDRRLVLHGFLGASVFEPPLLEGDEGRGEDGEGLDVWVPLTSALDPSIGGEIRLRLLFEPLHSRPKLTVDDFQILRRIGQGSFGQVFRVRKRDTKRIYALKVINKSRITSASALAQVLTERQILALTIDSPFLVSLKFSFQSPTELFFVIDYKAGGEMFQHLQRDGGRFDEEKVRFYVGETLLGLEFLHSKGIIYRDLKPENCLLDGSGHVVLCDFGLSKLLDSPTDKARTLCGTTSFLAPEVLLDVGYSFPADWWSLGVLLFEMCYGWSPFYAESVCEEYERILYSEIKIPNKKGYSDEVKDLLLKLMTRDPEQRLGAVNGAADIKRHAFFASIAWAKLALRQLSPPYKPPTHADDDQIDYYDGGRKGEWVFRDDGHCWQAPCGSRRGSGDGSGDAGGCAGGGGGGAGAGTGKGRENGVFRDFSWGGKEAKETRFAATRRGMASRGGGGAQEGETDTRRSSCV
ncbi:hypothetical protein JCM1840_005160 [Sporobolomyces johnsonii]